MWEVLGIARTTDKVAIRRAYAAKLRSIDSDRDPAAFIQVRQAYEAALAWSNRPKPTPASGHELESYLMRRAQTRGARFFGAKGLRRIPWTTYFRRTCSSITG